MSTATPNIIYARLREMLRVDAQRTVAARLGVSQQFLSDVLRGRRPLGVRIPRALGYTRIERYESRAPRSPAGAGPEDRQRR